MVKCESVTYDGFVVAGRQGAEFGLVVVAVETLRFVGARVPRGTRICVKHFGRIAN